ncbi:MAG TPA: hypothetical protein VEU30_00260, partial [Thermoanaerobaculia bacterium]|nr:hypothetical protein [Thermoanaerobaculia bacterium]
MTPNGKTYIVEVGTSHNVAFTATVSDRNRINVSTIAVWLNGSPIQSWTWEPSLTGIAGTSGVVRGTVSLSRGGDNYVNVNANDQFGNHGTALAVMKVEFTDPQVPNVHSDVHHSEYRDATRSQLVLGYSTPAYTSMGAPRGVTLQYISEFASPSMFVQLDTEVNYRTFADVTAVSLRVIDDSTGAFVTPEYFWGKKLGRQRMGAFVPMPAKPTGAYMYTLAVRVHFASSAPKEVRAPARVMIVNESASRYGAGWVLGGIPRIYAASGGVILHEGNGILRWLGSLGCNASNVCAYKQPEGDFTAITYNRSTSTWTRTYSDGSITTFSDRGILTTSTDAAGRTTVFTWQNTADAAAVPVLASIADPMQKTTRFSYSAAGYLQSITDPAGRTVSVTINASGDLIKLGGGSTLDVAYGTNHLPTSFTDESGTWKP